MILTLDLETTNRLLDEAVAEKGENYVYEDEDGMLAGDGANCLYTHLTPTGDLASGCLVGDVLVRHGVDLKELAQWGDGRYNDGGIPESAANLIARLSEKGILLVDTDAEDLLVYAQDAQDSGKPWGSAVRVAREFLADGLANNNGEEL